MNEFNIIEPQKSTENETSEEKERRLAEVWKRMEELRKGLEFSGDGYSRFYSTYNNK
jgi:hypothetical protein